MSHSRIFLARLLASFPPVLRPRSPLGRADGLDLLESSELEPLLAANPDPPHGTHSDLLPHPQEPLPAGYERLEQEVLEIVGRFPASAGGTADVLEGRIGDRRVAIKSYRCYLSSDRLLTYVRYYKEALTGSHLRHQNVVSYIGMYATLEHPLALVFDFMSNFDLGRYLKSDGNAGRLVLLSDIARGIEYIHKQGVVHGDINMENILVDSDGHARVAGLGAAYISSLIPGLDVDEFFEAHGSAPELVHSRRSGSGSARATKESDIHAFGVLAYEIFAGEAPVFEEGKLAGICSKFCGRLPFRPEHPELSDRVWKMIKGCLKKDPSRRKTIGEVVVALEAELSSG